MLTDKYPIPLPCDTFSSDPSSNAVRHKQVGRSGGKVDWNNDVTRSDKIYKTDWHEDFYPTMGVYWHIVKSWRACFNKSNACGTDTLAQLRGCSTELNLKWRMTDRLSEPFTEQGLRWQSLGSRKGMEWSEWTILSPRRRSWPHILSFLIRGTNRFVFVSTNVRWTQWRSGTGTPYRSWRNVSIC